MTDNIPDPLFDQRDSLDSHSSNDLDDLNSLRLYDGIPLTRQSSFEKFVSNLSNQQNELSIGSVMKIQHFWRSFHELTILRKKVIKMINNDIISVKNIFQSVRSTNSFNSCQEIVMNSEFVHSLQVTIHRLYPSLSKPSRDARLAASAILITHYPNDILQDSYDIDGNPQPPSTTSQDIEVVECTRAAKLVVLTLESLLDTILNISNLPLKSAIVKYNDKHRGFYASFLYFMKCLDAWKQYDKLRIAQQLELSFVQSYSLWLSAKQIVASNPLVVDSSPKSPSRLKRNAENQLQKIKAAYRSIVGSNAAEARFEELSAIVESSIENSLQNNPDSNNDGETSAKESKTTTPTSAAAAAAQRQSFNVPSNPLVIPDEIEQSILSQENQTLLARLVERTGFEEEKLVYEMIYDSTFQLPSVSPDFGGLSVDDNNASEASSSASSDNSISAEKFRKKLLYLLNDRLVWSLKNSPVTDAQGHDIVVGMVVPVALPSKKSESSVIAYESARVTSINKSQAEDTSDKIESIDLQYLSDNSLERKVLLNRLKLSSQPKDPTLFLSSLQDILQRISSLTPNRKDLHERLAESFDFTLLHQMIVHDAMSIEDCLKLFYHLIVSILRLQAPVRSEISKRWWKSYLDEATILTSFQDFIPLIPKFFTYAAHMIDEIHRDMSNYYISTLAPSIVEKGPSYLLSKLMNRLAGHPLPDIHQPLLPPSINSLDSTASLLLNQVTPKANLVSMLDDLFEAGWTLAPQTSATGATAIPAVSSNNVSYSEIIRDDRGMRAISARAFVQLLQLPIRLSSPEAIRYVLPELLIYDANRLASVRDLIDKVSLQAVLLIASRQTIAKLGKNKSASQDAQELEFLYRLDVLLSAEDVELNHLTTEVLRHVTTTASVSRTIAIEGILLEDYIKKAVSDVIKANNPILQLLSKRVGKLVLRGVLGSKYHEKLASYSLQSPGIVKNIDSLVELASKVFTTNWSVYGTVYQIILTSEDFTKRM